MRRLAVKSSDLIKSITAESDEGQRLRILAAERLGILEHDYAERIQRLLTGAALTMDIRKWTLNYSTSSFAAPWRVPAKTYASITVYLSFDKVDSWSVLSPLFELLDARGIDIDKWSSRDDPASYSRCYTNQIHLDEEDGTEVEIQITAALPGDTETCKRVIVGYQDVPARTEPIYKLECEGGN
jgi:hypothetical protein